MIPSLAELRKKLVRDPASESVLDRNLWSPTKAARSFRLPSSQFPVLCESLPKIAPHRGLACRLCLRLPESAIVLPEVSETA